jgi:hypothetical protein
MPVYQLPYNICMMDQCSPMTSSRACSTPSWTLSASTLRKEDMMEGSKGDNHLTYLVSDHHPQDPNLVCTVSALARLAEPGAKPRKAALVTNS